MSKIVGATELAKLNLVDRDHFSRDFFCFFINKKSRNPGYKNKWIKWSLQFLRITRPDSRPQVANLSLRSLVVTDIPTADGRTDRQSGLQSC